MGHEGHEHEEEKPLSFFASPIQHRGHGHSHGHVEPAPTSSHSSDLEHQKTHDSNAATFGNMDCEIHHSPAFHRHAEATTSELFYDLFFVANLTTFTANLEINDKNSLTAYVGFFSLLWLTWYQVSLYDVRFSTDSVFERVAKALHFGVMVGFAIIGSQWKPGQEETEFTIYKAFGIILLVSRLTLVCQYGVTLWYSKQYKKTIIPLAMIIASTLIAGILYGALTPVFPGAKRDAAGDLILQKSNLYIAWYTIGIAETLLTVGVSCIWRIISFKGTHMVQRMSLLTLIILGEGIIVICKSISKIIKNDYIWTAPVIGQVIAAVLIIYFLYMLYFDRIEEEHFGTIKQQWWSFLHFPLHTSLVLVLQGVSLLVIWLQAVQSFTDLGNSAVAVLNIYADGNYTSGAAFAADWSMAMDYSVFNYIPKGVDASKDLKTNDDAIYALIEGYDNLLTNPDNKTAGTQVASAVYESFAVATKVLFDSLSVTVPKKKKDLSKGGDDGSAKAQVDIEAVFNEYVDVFELVFTYVFVAGGLSLILITILGALSLPPHKKKLSSYIRLGINGVCGLGIALLSTLKYNMSIYSNYLPSAWMVPTICLVYFICVISTHVRLPGKAKSH